MLEVALVAAYCELEADEFKRHTPAPASSPTKPQRLVYHAAPKEKP